MPTETAPLPTEAIVPPVTPITKPAAKAKEKADPVKTEAPVTSSLPGPLSDVSVKQEVEHDFEPRNDYERIALKTGEIRRKPKPGTEALAEEIAGDITTPVKTEKPKIAVDDEKGFDDKDLQQIIREQFGGKTPKALADAFDVRNKQIRDERRQRKETEAKLAELTGKTAEYEKLQAEIDGLRKAPKIDAETEAKLKEFDSYKARLEEAETYLAQTNIERTDRFKREITAPLQAVEKEAIAIAKKYELNEKDVLSALRNLGEDRADVINELVTDMKSYDATKFTTAALAYEQIEGHKQNLLNDARAHLEQLNAQEDAAIQRQQAEAAQRTAAQQEQWNKTVPTKWDELTTKAGIKEIEGVDGWNNALAVARTFVEKTPFHELTVESQVDVMTRAGLHPLLLGKIVALEKEKAEYEAELAKYDEATPGAGDGVRPTGKRETAEDDRSKGGFAETVAKRALELGIINS
jgi:hypothetical protein